MARLPRSASGRSALTVARACARAAAKVIRDGYEVSPTVGLRFKGRGNVVTQTDIAAERAVFDILAAEYPDHAIMSEETEFVGDREGWRWVVDPLDGTRNYVSGIPLFCINIALCYAGEPLLGLTYEPLRREEFAAQRGQRGVPQRTPDARLGEGRRAVVGLDL